MAQANGSFGLDPDGKPATSNGWNYFASLILGALQQMSGALAGPSGTGVVGTYTTTHVANNGSTTIPTTAKRWAVNFIGTGTGNTLGSNTSVSGGQGFSDAASPAVALTVACDGSTVADIIYSTT